MDEQEVLLPETVIISMRQSQVKKNHLAAYQTFWCHLAKNFSEHGETKFSPLEVFAERSQEFIVLQQISDIEPRGIKFERHGENFWQPPNLSPLQLKVFSILLTKQESSTGKFFQNFEHSLIEMLNRQKEIRLQLLLFLSENQTQRLHCGSATTLIVNTAC